MSVDGEKRVKTPAQLDRDIAKVLSPRAMTRQSRMITGELARSMSRYEFIANWLVVVTKKKENRGPLGYHVRKIGRQWRIYSPVGGGTIVYATSDPALLFDYARRTQLGPHIRDAESFRGDAFTEVLK